MSTISQPVPAHLYSYPPAETKPVAEVIVRGHSASIIDVTMPIRRVVYIATLNIARIILSSRRHASAIRGPLTATLREGLRDRLDARGASAVLPIRYRPSKDTSRWTEPLPPLEQRRLAAPNSPTESGSAFSKTSVVAGGSSVTILTTR